MQEEMMQKKVVEGTTENLNMLKNKVDYIGFELGEAPDFLKEFEPLNYKVPKIYDETTYRIYRYVPIEEIEILITPSNRLDSLEKRYKEASPLFTYMEAKTDENIEKYARFLKMINQTRIEDIEEIEKWQEAMKEQVPYEVKFEGNFKWQVYYSDYAKKYFMLASAEEMDNSPLFYLLKKKIQQNKNKKSKECVFIPVCNEEYSEQILKKSDIADVENYLWFFTKNWPSIYEVTNIEGETSLQIVGETPVYDKVTSKFNLKYTDKKEAIKEYKLIKALFILAYEMPDEYEFRTQIDDEGRISFCYENDTLSYESLPDFIKKEALKRIQQNIDVKLETKNLQADIKDLKRKSEEQTEEYLRKERQIYNFLECKKTFLGKVKYFFKSKKKDDVIVSHMNKDRMKDILSHDKIKEEVHDNRLDLDKQYTVEDLLNICKELHDSIRENKNVKLDIKALNNKVENLERKIKNATLYIDEIEKHKKSIFEFWKFANKDEVKVLEEGNNEEEKNALNLKRTFNYEDDIENLSNNVDLSQRKKLSHEELDATFAANFVLDGINIVSKDRIIKEDEEKIKSLLYNLQNEYSLNIEKIEKKDFDIFGNVSEDKTKIKTLKNNTHREVEKDKFKILDVNMNTQLDTFMEKLVELKNILQKETNKIETPYDLTLYKASTEKLETTGFDKFDLNPIETLKKIDSNKNEEIYLYKINVPEKTHLIFYSNIVFFENKNQTLPLGMDISQETLINMDMYGLELKDKEEFNINVFHNTLIPTVQKIIVYEYNIIPSTNS